MSWILVLVILVGGSFFATSAASSISTNSIFASVSGGPVEGGQYRRRFSFLSNRPLSSLYSTSKYHDPDGIATNVNRKVQVHQRTSSKSSPMQTFMETILNSRRHLMAAAVARSTSIFIMYPADVIKTRLQMQQVNALRITGLFNGVTGSLVGQVPYGVLTFGSYEMYKSYFLDHLPSTIPPIFKYAVGKKNSICVHQALIALSLLTSPIAYICSI
jgi:Mitochondrial carrier protein